MSHRLVANGVGRLLKYFDDEVGVFGLRPLVLAMVLEQLEESPIVVRGQAP
jgi:hypothetical protein